LNLEFFLLQNHCFMDFWHYHLRASSLAAEVHELPKGSNLAVTRLRFLP
jgi:hypothetical protein